ncbi:MAG: SusC/RagA family TonB-linked outer membrane protein [Mariniphaga sp.]
MKRKIFQMLLLGMCVLFTSNMYAQVKVSGVVKGSSGEVLPGATIVVKGTTNGVVTNVDGQYNITVPNAQSTLVVSFIGMESDQVAVNGKSSINITLNPIAVAVEEVVVTALGIKKEKKALGYNISSVNSDNLETGGVSNALKSLEGKVTGVQMNSLSSNPTSSVLFNIRGATSLAGILGASNINNSSQPLIVIDGIPVGSNQVSTVSGIDVGNRITSINPNDIESVSVLKGASAAALYGSSAGNGVIMITTKDASHAKKGLGITISSEISMNQVYNAPPVQRQFFQGDGANSFGPTDGTGGGWAINDTQNNNTPVDQYDLKTQTWYKDIFRVQGDANPIKAFLRTGVMETTNIAVTGNYDKGNYRLNIGNVSSALAVPYNKTTRNDISFSSVYKLNDKLTFSSEASYSHTFTPQASRIEGNNGDNPISLAMQTPINLPKMSVWKSADRYIKGYQGVYQNTPYLNNPGEARLSKVNSSGQDNAIGNDNPYYTAQYNLRTYNKDVIFGKIQFDYDIVKSLKFTIRSGMNYEGFGLEHKIPWDSKANNRRGGYEMTNTASFAIRSDALLSYDKYFLNDKLSVNALVGVNYNYIDGGTGSSFSGTDFLTAPNNYSWSGISAAAKQGANIYHNLPDRPYSAYATASIGWKGMVYLDLSGRNDWVGLLASQKDSHFYPGASLSWLASETFKGQLSWVNLLKLRAGYAQTGFGIGHPYNLDTYGTNGVTFSGVTTGNVGGSLVDANIKPELNVTSEGGLDFGLFNNRISGEFTVYEKHHINQIQNLPVVSSTGFNNVLANMGSVKSTGIEATLTVVPVRNHDWEWSVTANGTTFKSYIDNIDSRFTTSLVGYAGNTYLALFKGAKVGDLYAQNPLPVIQTGIYKGSLSMSGEGTQTISKGMSPDMVKKIGFLGNMNPDAILGLSTNVKFKNWDLGVVTSLRLGGVFVSETAKRMADAMALNVSQYMGKDYGKYFTGGQFAGGLKSMPSPDAIFPNGYSDSDDSKSDFQDWMTQFNGDPRYFGYMNGYFLDPNKVDLSKLTADQKLSQADDKYVKNGADPLNTIYFNPYYIAGQNFWKNAQFVTRSATVFKIKEINLTYHLNKVVAHKLHCENIAFTAFAKNVMFWTKNQLHEDPETAFNDGVSGQGVAMFTMPPVRIMGLKVTVGF